MFFDQGQTCDFFQFWVVCSSGAEKIVHNLRMIRWSKDDFVVLKVLACLISSTLFLGKLC